MASNVSLAGRKRRAAAVTASPEAKRSRGGAPKTPEKAHVVVLDGADEDDEEAEEVLQPSLEALLRFNRSAVEGLSAARRAVVGKLQVRSARLSVCVVMTRLCRRARATRGAHSAAAARAALDYAAWMVSRYVRA